MSDTNTVRTAIEELLEDAWARMSNDLRVELHEQWMSLDAARTAEVDAARQEMQRQVDLARRVAADEAAARQAQTDTEIARLCVEKERAERARVQAEHELAVMRQRLEEVQATGAGARPLSLVDLVDAAQTMQQARSLAEVLDALTRAAQSLVGGASLYVVRGDCLQEWSVTGLSEASEAPKRLWPAESPLWFEDDRGTFPLCVGGSAVGVLSVEATLVDGDPQPAWVAAIDLLTRHASLALEALTLRRRAHLDRRTDVYRRADETAPVGDPH